MDFCEFERNYSKNLFENAVIFLNAAVKCLSNGVLEKNNMILTISEIQVAFELALKSSIVSSFGIRMILEKKQNCLSDAEIINLYKGNRLRIKEFETLKNFVKSQRNLYNFSHIQYSYIDNFQKYRNTIFHSSPHFTDEEKSCIEKDLIYMLIHILGTIMSDEVAVEERSLMQENLDKGEYLKLLNNPEYEKEFYCFLEEEYNRLYTCPYCSTKTMNDDKLCLRCFIRFSDYDFFGYVNCSFCHEDMVIFDNANIDNEGNGHMIRGLCLNCGQDTMVYKCPECSNSVNAEIFHGNNCREGYCKLVSD